MNLNLILSSGTSEEMQTLEFHIGRQLLRPPGFGNTNTTAGKRAIAVPLTCWFGGFSSGNSGPML